MTPESQMRNPDVLAGLSALASGQPIGEPSADEMSRGVLDGLRQVLSIVVTTARTVPDLADDARDVRQSVMKMMLRVQTMADQGNEQGGGGY